LISVKSVYSVSLILFLTEYTDFTEVKKEGGCFSQKQPPSFLSLDRR
ncbi:hypothetical protein SAMN04488090_3943, partial [Siphonobacter aquaeclarae]